MQVGIGYTVRDFCDGQSLASPASLVSVGEALSTVRRLECSCGVSQKVLRGIGHDETSDGPGAGSDQGVPLSRLRQ